MPRPRKVDDYIVRRIADLFHYADRLQFSKLKHGEEWVLTLADKRVLITGVRDIHCCIGQLLCDLKAEKRTYVLRQLIKALEGKSDKKRKTKPDEIALVCEAYRRAKAKLKGLYKGDNPTWREADTEYYKLTGWHLDRRALRDAGCPVRPGRRPGRRGRQK